jgi:hypothetical protein
LDRPDTGDSLKAVPPKLLLAHADRRNNSKTGHHDTMLFHIADRRFQIADLKSKIINLKS